MKHKGNRPVNRARPGRDARREKALNFFCGAAGILTFLALWQLGATYSRFGRFIPGPIEVIPKFFLSFTQPIGVKRMGGHILASLARVAAGYSLAAVTGIAVGIVTGRSRVMNALLNPFIELIRPIPGIAWIPISILWFGTGETGKVFIIFISTFTMIAVSVHQGASSVDPALIGAAKMLMQGEKTPAELIRAVCSPGGTTLAGMQVLEERDLYGMVAEACDKCTARAYELGK